jgi:membrane protein involved in colicin uptake
MTAKKTFLPTDILSLMSENFALPESLTGQSDGMFQAQAKLLAGMEEITREWLQRRREANETGIRAAEHICSCTDPSEMMVAYFDWLGGALRRLSDDTTALSEKALALTASATRAGANGAAKPKAKAAKAKAQGKAKAKAAKAEAKPAAQTAAASAQPSPAVRAVESKQRLAG